MPPFEGPHPARLYSQRETSARRLTWPAAWRRSHGGMCLGVEETWRPDCAATGARTAARNMFALLWGRQPRPCSPGRLGLCRAKGGCEVAGSGSYRKGTGWRPSCQAWVGFAEEQQREPAPQPPLSLRAQLDLRVVSLQGRHETVAPAAAAPALAGQREPRWAQVGLKL